MKYIRDGLYGYIAVTQIEDALLNHPSVLRLHKILQNSTLYHTYPFNRGTRFPHSLGTMHVASQLFRALVTNSKDSEVTRLLAATTRVIEERGFKPKDISGSNKYLFNLQAERAVDKTRKAKLKPSREDDQFFVKNGWIVEPEAIEGERPLRLKKNYVKNVLLQAIRLAAIVHDLGHPPYSHVVEFSLEDLEKRMEPYTDSQFHKTMTELSNSYRYIIGAKTTFWKELSISSKLHERTGVVLIDDLYNDKNGHGIKIRYEADGISQFFDISFAICVTLIAVEQYGHYTKEPFVSALTKNEDLGCLYPLANIIAGPVDCDRLDYLVRDATNSGTLDFISFDQQRIINNINLTNIDEGTIVGKSTKGEEIALSKAIYVPSFDRRAFSALADFFYTRYRQFRWLIGHHNVVRTDHSMSRALLMLAAVSQEFIGEKDLFPEGKIEGDIREIVASSDFDRLLNLKDPATNLRYVDDSWLDNCLQGILYKLQQIPPNVISSQASTVMKYLQVVIERRKDLMIAIWKNEEGFRYFARGFKYSLNKVSEAEIEKITFEPAKKRIITARDQTENINGTNLLLKYWAEVQKNAATPYSVMLPIEKELNSGKKQIQFALKTFSPYQRVHLKLENGNSIPLEKMSNMIPKLGVLSTEGLMLYAFDFGDPHITWGPAEINCLGSKVAEILLAKILEDVAGLMPSGSSAG